MKIIKYILIGLSIFVPAILLAAPDTTFLPNRLFVATTTAGCAQFSSLGLIFSTTVNCGSGSVSGGSQNTLTYWLTSTTIGATSSPTVGYITATSSIASQFPYASSTALTVSGTAYFPGSGIWNSSGNVGIGTTGPTSLLSLGAGVREITVATVDGTDTSQLAIAGAGVYGDTRGGGIQMNGNEVTTIGGLITLSAGNVSSGHIQFNTGGANVMRITNGGNVGIGTTSPVSKLSVVGESAFAGGASVGIGYAGTAAPTGGMIIEGNVGIGTTGPTSKLYISGVASASSADVIPLIAIEGTQTTKTVGTGGSIGFVNGVGSDGLNNYVTSRILGSPDSATNNNIAGRLYFQTRNQGTGLFQNVMLMDGLGNVGIGTTTPATTLDINGYAKVLQTSTTTACSAAIQGSIFYNQANDHFWGCGAGSVWKQLDI